MSKPPIEKSEVMFTHCDCGDVSHTMQFMLVDWGDDCPELYMGVQLNQRHPWWKRLGYAAMYVLGKRSRFSYGHWDSGGISLESAQELMVLLGRFLAIRCQHPSTVGTSTLTGEQVSEA